MGTLSGRVVFITGASRGIGRAIALRCARDGARVVLAAKSDRPHPKLPGTIHTVAEEVREAGGEALPLRLDVRDADAIEQAVATAAETFGGIDIVVNNAGYISLTPIRETPVKRFDLMIAINVRAAYALTRAALPWLEKSDHAHVLNMSPPISLEPRWLAGHVAYTISKYGMSMLTLGLAEELRDRRIAVNSLWPRTTIATAAISVHFPKEIYERSRRPEIVADAAHALLVRDPATATGRTWLDEEILREEGVTDFSVYALTPGAEPFPDLYIAPS
ncbi:MAG: NAD(P)-dependent oxidoreductase [Acidobacteria bacterium]|nr:MAG: NAD(P)-dependent oxidoreductase [Acidobacteriota bacterium]